MLNLELKGKGNFYCVMLKASSANWTPTRARRPQQFSLDSLHLFINMWHTLSFYTYVLSLTFSPVVRFPSPSHLITLISSFDYLVPTRVFVTPRHSSSFFSCAILHPVTTAVLRWPVPFLFPPLHFRCFGSVPFQNLVLSFMIRSRFTTVSPFLFPSHIPFLIIFNRYVLFLLPFYLLFDVRTFPFPSVPSCPVSWFVRFTSLS